MRGVFPQLEVGQTLRLWGSWEVQNEYGLRLNAAACQELTHSSKESLQAYLGGGMLPGVGLVTARRLVEQFGDQVLSMLDGPGAMAALMACPGIARRSAARIKSAWDATSGRDALHLLSCC